MYYEERILDNRLWCRSTPDGHWTLVPYEVLMGRMMLAERNLDKALAALQQKSSR